MKVANLGSRGSNLDQGYAQRLVELERQASRAAARQLTGYPGYSSIRVSKPAHGWTVGTWLKFTGGNWTTAAAAATFVANAIGMVMSVIDNDTIEVLIHGRAQIIGASYTAYTLYYLSTSAGVAASTAPVAPNVSIPLFIAYQDGWIDVIGLPSAKPRTIALDDLSDVTLTTPATGELLKFNGTVWVNATAALTELSDVTIATPSNDQVLSYDSGTGKWKNRTISTGATTLAALTDVDPAGWSNGYVLTYDTGSTKWKAVAPLNALATLSDVTITSVANLDFLRYDSGSSKWKNVNLGPMSFSGSSLALDGGISGSATNVGIGAASSRFILGGPGLPLDFILDAIGTPATDICARIKRTSTTRVTFYDQAVGASDGTEVLRWNCSSSAASRAFEFMVAMRSPFLNGFSISTTGTTIGTGAATVVMTSTEIDPSSAYNTGTGVFTAPVTGNYQVVVGVRVDFRSSSANAKAALNVSLYLNGANSWVTMGGFVYIQSSGEDGTVVAPRSQIVSLTAGDTLTLVANYIVTAGSIASATMYGGWSVTYVGT